MVESKSMFTWACPQELRIAAMQALEKLDPECVQSFWSKGGINQEDLMLAPLEHPLPPTLRRHRHLQRGEHQVLLVNAALGPEARAVGGSDAVGVCAATAPSACEAAETTAGH